MRSLRDRWDRLGAGTRWGIAGLLLAATLLLGLWWSADTSRPLTAAEDAEFGRWVGLTGEPAVAQAYARQRQDGRLTLEEARAVVEVAKAHGPGYGLAAAQNAAAPAAP